MPIVHHSSPAAFLAAGRTVLARDRSEAMMFASRVRTLAEQSPDVPVRRYLATYRSPRFRGIALQFRESPLFLGPSDARSAAPFADDLATRWAGVPAVIGQLDACESFARRWSAHTGRVHALRFHLRNHLLVEVTPQPAPPGRPRVARPDDRSWLVAAQLAFVAETGIPDAPAEQPGRVDRGLARDAYWIWEAGERVAYAAWTPADETTARIGPVWTDPRHRGRGYASALVATLSQALLDAGRRPLSLSTDLANPVSNAIYARIGFRPSGESWHFDLVERA